MKVQSITIVGGGTSAWLAAAYLHKNQPEMKITIVDKEIGNPIGVGEATLLSFKPFMEECGFPVEDWFVPLDAGYKSGIMFANWRHQGDDMWHPFYKGNRNVDDQYKLWDIWSKNQSFNFKKYALSSWDCSVEHNAMDANNIDSYAFHIDCGKLVVYVQEKLKGKVKMIMSDVVNVVHKDNGDINYLELKDGSTVDSDLYIDCTGFKNVLRTPQKRIDLSDRLFVNTAVAHPIPYTDRENEFKPYAVCEAVDHGWIWKIGVSSRIGSGMVFNRNITDIETAKEYFANHWDNKIDKDNVRVIHWDPFYHEDLWVGNVVSIGLSAGFIEPLESTGVGLITYGIAQINNAIRERYCSEHDKVNYNNLMKVLFEDCVDFVSMHYANNGRESKFWNHVRQTFNTSERMLHHMTELISSKVSIPSEGKFHYMFGGGNWALMLIQLGYPVAPRNNDVDEELAGELIMRNYIEHEKQKHVWSRHHSTEVDRIHELKKL